MSTKVNKITSLGPKLLKTMGNTKCATFNEFVCDALTQKNYNVVYTATKTRERAFEAEVFDSKAPMAAKPQYRAPTPNMQYQPSVMKNPMKTRFRKGYSIALPRGNTRPSNAKAPPANRPC